MFKNSVDLDVAKGNSYQLDFVIKSKTLTKKQEKELSEFIVKRKLEIRQSIKSDEGKQRAA